MELLRGIVWLQGPSGFLIETLNLLQKVCLRLRCMVIGHESLLGEVKSKEWLFWNKLSHLEVAVVI